MLHSIKALAKIAHFNMSDLRDVQKISQSGFKSVSNLFRYQKLLLDLVNTHQMQADEKEIKIQLNSMSEVPVHLFGDN